MRSRLGLKALGLCALMLGLMAFASSAQAEPLSKWAIVKANLELVTIANPEKDPKGIGDTLLPEVQIKELEVLAATGVKEAILLTEVAKTATALLCTGALLRNAAGTAAPLLLLEGSILGKVVFTGCITKLKGVTQAACKPHAPAAAPEGTIETELAKALIVLHASAPEGMVVKIVPDPDVTKPFVTVTLGKPGVENECAIGEKLPVFGELALQDPAPKVESVEHLISEFAGLTDLYVFTPKTAEHKATIDGSALVKLIGAHEGLKWGGLPG